MVQAALTASSLGTVIASQVESRNGSPLLSTDYVCLPPKKEISSPSQNKLGAFLLWNSNMIFDTEMNACYFYCVALWTQFTSNNSILLVMLHPRIFECYLS